MGRGAWLNQSPFGVMVHYLPVTADQTGSCSLPWNDAVSQFDVKRFAQELADAGARWLILPLGQNQGPYLSPNPILKQWIGRDYFTTRDLFADIAHELSNHNIALIGYVPTEMWCREKEVQNALGWNLDPVDKSVFMDRWYDTIAYWGNRFSTLLAGWWCDGCYKAKDKPFIPENQNGWTNERFDKDRWFDALRTGNPNRAISMCPGASLMTYVYEEEDFLSGECGDLLPPPTGLPANMAPHALTWLDCFWMHTGTMHDKPCPTIPTPRFNANELTAWIQQYRERQGGCTINIGIYRDGTLPISATQCLAAVRENLNKANH